MVDFLNTNTKAATAGKISSDPLIAIVGCGLRLPGNLHSLEELWDFLLIGGDGIRDLPEGRWRYDLYDPQPRSGSTYVRRAGYVDGIDLIDTSFLGVSPKEAAQIDPQQRMLIETAFEGLEMAGLPLHKLSKTRTGVFVGISSNDYIQLMIDDPRHGNAYSNTGGALSIAANRISYAFDLRGPSMAIDTACSSGLTALDYAVRSLRQGVCEVAIVGAANALIRSEPFVGFCAATMLSPDAQCRAFDADGKGFVRAEGAVSFILKPLDVALRENDPIIGLIQGSDTNNDGQTSGLSLPNGDAQQELFGRVFSQGNIDPDNIAYVEAHGTGTAAGDPIEATAIGRAIAQKRSGDAPLLMGSIKSNIGHMEPASGLAGLAKALLCLRHRQVPRSLHFETPNPAIDFETLRIKVPQETMPLADTKGPAMVAVNSFGFGGANAHVVVSEAPAQEHVTLDTPSAPWILVSARSPEALKNVASDIATYVETNADTLSLGHLCNTLLTRRSWHTHRAAIWGDSLAEIREGLVAVAHDREHNRIMQSNAISGARTAFVFTGNGPQWWAMGRELLQASDIFRDTLEEIDAQFRTVSGLRLIDEMSKTEETSLMSQTEIAQPALFGVQVGIVRCLAAQGLFPDATVGHSAGELAAAYCSGQFDLGTIIRIVSARSQEQAKTAGAGAMAAISLNVDAAQAVLADYDSLVIAGDNGPEAVSIAGSINEIDALVEELSAEGIFATRLKLNYAFHSPAMDPIEHSFRHRIETVHGRQGETAFYSTVTGERLSGTDMDVEYWWRNLRDPVQFRPAINRMIEDGYNAFVEVGPHPNLLGYVKGTARAVSRSVRLVETLRRETDETDQLRRAVASAAVSGSAIDLSRQFSIPAQPLALPRYPWQRERYFNDAHARPPVAALPTKHMFLGSRISLGKDVWHNDITLSRLSFVGDHMIRDAVLFPATGFLETAIAAGRSLSGEDTLELRSVRIEKALVLQPDREVGFETFLDRNDHSLSIRSRAISIEDDRDGISEPFTEHVRAVLETRPATPKSVDLDALRARMTRGHRTAEEHYALTAERGLNYGPLFQTVAGIELGDGELLAELNRTTGAGSNFTIDPMMADGALQAMIGLIDSGQDRRLFLPVQLERLIVRGNLKDSEAVYAHIVTRGANRFYLSADIVLIKPDGTVVAEMFGFQVRSVGTGAKLDALHLRHALKPLEMFDTSVPELDPETLLLVDDIHPAFAKRRTVMSDYDQALERLTAAFVADTFFQLSGGRDFNIADFLKQGLVATEHRRYCETILGQAVAHGTITRDGDTYSAHQQADPRRDWEEVIRRYPGYSAELFLMARIWKHLPALLSAERQLLDMLFPSSGSPLMEQIYEQGFTSEEANHAIAAAIACAVEKMPSGRPIRILEVGGGTGGTTAHILAALDHNRVD
ncbi:type I polyketide synthase, partial [Marivita sp.]|uniref:type I polyketide synthase n=1 Tax=Marivita sp. TaxID=2003365 RepID=UPI003F722261